MTTHDGSASYFAELSRDLFAAPHEEPTLDVVVARALEVVGAAQHASVSMRRGRSTETIAATSALAEDCDRLQYALGEGPCVDAAMEQEPFVSGDLAHDRRWPSWGPRAAETGVASVLSVQLSTPDEVLGALNLYAESTGAFDPDDVDVAVVFTTHAANALGAARLVTGLRTAMESRHLIGVAQGILIHSYGLDLDRSFELLRRYSSHSNTKLRDVAQYVVAHGRLPGTRGAAGS
jgi:GAF domain-containing protein